MLRMARRDMMASVTAFLNCLKEEKESVGSSRRRADNRAKVNSPHRQVHGADGEEREGVDFDHDGHEGHVEENFDEAWGGKKHLKGLVLGQPQVG